MSTLTLEEFMNKFKSITTNIDEYDADELYIKAVECTCYGRSSHIDILFSRSFEELYVKACHCSLFFWFLYVFEKIRLNKMIDTKWLHNLCSYAKSDDSKITRILLPDYINNINADYNTKCKYVDDILKTFIKIGKLSKHYIATCAYNLLDYNTYEIAMKYYCESASVHGIQILLNHKMCITHDNLLLFVNNALGSELEYILNTYQDVILNIQQLYVYFLKNNKGLSYCHIHHLVEELKKNDKYGIYCVEINEQPYKELDNVYDFTTEHLVYACSLTKYKIAQYILNKGVKPTKKCMEELCKNNTYDTKRILKLLEKYNTKVDELYTDNCLSNIANSLDNPILKRIIEVHILKKFQNKKYLKLVDKPDMTRKKKYSKTIVSLLNLCDDKVSYKKYYNTLHIYVQGMCVDYDATTDRIIKFDEIMCRLLDIDYDENAHYKYDKEVFDIIARNIHTLNKE